MDSGHFSDSCALAIHLRRDKNVCFRENEKDEHERMNMEKHEHEKA